VTTVISAIRNGNIVDRYHTSGSLVADRLESLRPFSSKKAKQDKGRRTSLPSRFSSGSFKDQLLDVMDTTH
jgi:hypothetical protein